MKKNVLRLVDSNKKTLKNWIKEVFLGESWASELDKNIKNIGICVEYEDDSYTIYHLRESTTIIGIIEMLKRDIVEDLESHQQ